MIGGFAALVDTMLLPFTIDVLIEFTRDVFHLFSRSHAALVASKNSCLHDNRGCFDRMSFRIMCVTI